MSSIGKVHLNGSTVLSLNDRFTIMQKQGGGAPAQPRPRARSRSRSRSRLVPQHIAAHVPISPRTTLRNRSLLQQLDQKHKKSINLKPQNAIGVRGRRRLIRPSAALINTANTRRRLRRRSQSVAKQIATIKADLIKNVKRVRRLTKSNSTLNLTEQLGVRGRPRLRRNNAVAGERAASRSRVRSVSRNRANLTRTNSKQNLRGRSASRQRQGAPIRLNRSNSRLNLNGRIAQRGGPNNMNGRRRSRSQSRSNVRKNTSLNARLGVKRQNPPNGQRRQPNKQGLRNVQRGRITKRPNPNARNQIGNGTQQQQQRGRSRSRVRKNAVQMVRSQSRSRNNVARGNNQNNQRNQTRNPQRGPNRQNNQQTKRGGRQQARGRPQKKTGKREPPKSREQLDAELDQYMVNTKSSLDQEMSIYTK